MTNECPNCGEELTIRTDDSAFCPDCGYEEDVDGLEIEQGNEEDES